MTGLQHIGTHWRSLLSQRDAEVAGFESWLAAASAAGPQCDLSAQLYSDYADWLGPVEGLPKKRQFMRGGLSKQRFAWRRARRAGQNPLATLRLFIKHLLEPLRVYRGEGRQDQPHQHVGQRKVLGKGRLERHLGLVHPGLSSVWRQGADSESPVRETSPAAKREVAQ